MVGEHPTGSYIDDVSSVGGSGRGSLQKLSSCTEFGPPLFNGRYLWFTIKLTSATQWMPRFSKPPGVLRTQ
eukprot:755594-Pyramimonas_sp.AAC.2